MVFTEVHRHSAGGDGHRRAANSVRYALYPNGWPRAASLPGEGAAEPHRLRRGHRKSKPVYGAVPARNRPQGYSSTQSGWYTGPALRLPAGQGSASSPTARKARLRTSRSWTSGQRSSDTRRIMSTGSRCRTARSSAACRIANACPSPARTSCGGWNTSGSISRCRRRSIKRT